MFLPSAYEYIILILRPGEKVLLVGLEVRKAYPSSKSSQQVRMLFVSKPTSVRESKLKNGVGQFGKVKADPRDRILRRLLNEVPHFLPLGIKLRQRFPPVTRLVHQSKLDPPTR